MSLWRATIRKAMNSSGLAWKWSNTYFIEASTSGEALGIAANFWINGEAVFHNQLAFAYEFYVNNTVDPPFTPGVTGGILPGVQRGLRPATLADVPSVLPSFNVVRVDFPIVGSRSSRKFYRLPLREGEVASQTIDTALQTAVQTGVNYIASHPAYRDVDGQLSGGGGFIRGITSRRLGRDAANAVPVGPAFG